MIFDPSALKRADVFPYWWNVTIKKKKFVHKNEKILATIC